VRGRVGGVSWHADGAIGHAPSVSAWPPHKKAIVSIQTRETRCLISTCEIPANLPYTPWRGAPRWPREPRRKTPESSSALSLRYSGARPVPLLVSAPYPPSDNVLGVKLCLAATETHPRTSLPTARCSLTLGWTDRGPMRPDQVCSDARYGGDARRWRSRPARWLSLWPEIRRRRAHPPYAGSPMMAPGAPSQRPGAASRQSTLLAGLCEGMCLMRPVL
jgi:hypothetical protein